VWRLTGLHQIAIQAAAAEELTVFVKQGTRFAFPVFEPDIIHRHMCLQRNRFSTETVIVASAHKKAGFRQISGAFCCQNQVQ
jgi:hypothetical protein